MPLFTPSFFSKNNWLFVIGLAFLLCSGCSTKKYLEPGQTFLNKNKIVFQDDFDIDRKQNLKYELKTIYKQKPNEKFFFTPIRLRRWFHYRNTDPGDTTLIKRFIKNNLAEEPSIYDRRLAESTSKSMANYLKNKGYFDASVTFEPTYKKHKTEVTYYVSAKNRYRMDSIDFISSDKSIERILNDLKEESYLQPGQPVSESLYSKERGRIKDKFQNLGYLYLEDNSIAPLGFYDTLTHKVSIAYEILPPRDSTAHRICKVGRITVIPNHILGDTSLNRDTLIQGIHFLLNDGPTIVKPASIIRAIQLKEGETFNKQQLLSTNIQLGNLEIYRFISIKKIPDPNNANILDVQIFLTPRKRMVASVDVEINNSSYNTTEAPISLLGTSFNMNFKNRNIAKSAIILDAEIATGVEWNLSNSNQVIYSSNISPGVDLFFPKFKDLNKMWGLANRLNFLSPRFYNQLRDKAKTRLSLNYSNVIITDFYKYQSFNGSVGYDLQVDAQNRFRINTSGLNYLLPKFEARFDSLRKQNEFLRRSFDNQLFTGFLFRDLSFTHVSKPKFGRSWFFRTDFEISGLEVLAANKIYNAIADQNRQFRISTADFSQYVRLNLDLRHYQKLGSGKTTLAHRLNTAIALPYGPYSKEVPYVKQFASGGPYSLRAWNIRELGPGAFVDETFINSTQPDTLIFYQSGDIKLEFSQEWRFPIFSVIEGAFFVDVGNVWTLQEDDRGPEALFGKNFWRQLAVGSGLGLRLDFSYFLFRFDFGLKIRKPYLLPDVPDDSYWLFQDLKDFRLRDLNPNLAIGYSF